MMGNEGCGCWASLGHRPQGLIALSGREEPYKGTQVGEDLIQPAPLLLQSLHSQGKMLLSADFSPQSSQLHGLGLSLAQLGLPTAAGLPGSLFPRKQRAIRAAKDL